MYLMGVIHIKLHVIRRAFKEINNNFFFSANVDLRWIVSSIALFFTNYIPSKFSKLKKKIMFLYEKKNIHLQNKAFSN